MKTVQRDQHFLQVLKKCKCEKFQKALFRHCDDNVIQTLSEIVHNVLNGNLKMSDEELAKLKKYKKPLRKINAYIKTHKCLKRRRRIIRSQVGGMWPLLAKLALSGLASLGGEKIINYGVDKIKDFLRK